MSNSRAAALPASPLPPVRPSATLKEQRARVSHKKRRRAQELEQKLIHLEDYYPEFTRQLRPARDAVHAERARTRQSDRDRVIFALEQGCNVMDDICDESGLSGWDAKQILTELIDCQLVQTKSEYRPTGSSDKPRILYVLTHCAP